MSISIDPATGLKVFNTRAASAMEDVIGTGYSVVEGEALTTLPPQPPGAVFNAQEQAKYREYKEERRGAADYMALEGKFSKYLQDPYSADPVPREALTDECEILVVGAGLAGLLLWHKLRAAGFVDVRFCEKGGDVGGTWYWNRYPGIACDVESYSYLPLLEEMDYYPTMKFASGFEIFEYCQKVAEKFGFYDHCLFHTTVEKTEWDEESGRWAVYTDRGDTMRARYVILANGILTTPKLARIENMESFEGEAFHTSRWHYDVALEGKRVGIIGTGATAVQAIPELAKIVSELYVFQRTPSTIDVRDQRETTQEEIDEWSHDPGWARARRARFAKISEARTAIKANDDYLAGRVADFKERKGPKTRLSPEELVKTQLNSNFAIMEQIRARVDAIVEDPKTAEALKPYYPYLCKRPTFHDEYLPTFNLPHVHLVDTAPTGVTQISPKGVVHEGIEYPLDVLIYATGFQWMATSTFNMITGRSGRTLTEKWESGGTKTFLGIQSADFPNLFIVTGPQGGGGSFNFTDSIDAHADYITWLLTTMQDKGIDVVDITPDSENGYAEHCRQADLLSAPLRDCLSYYNGYGEAEPGSLAYYGGRQWHNYRTEAQDTLEPFIFGPANRNVASSKPRPAPILPRPPTSGCEPPGETRRGKPISLAASSSLSSATHLWRSRRRGPVNSAPSASNASEPFPAPRLSCFATSSQNSSAQRDATHAARIPSPLSPPDRLRSDQPTQKGRSDDHPHFSFASDSDLRRSPAHCRQLVRWR